MKEIPQRESIKKKTVLILILAIAGYTGYTYWKQLETRSNESNTTRVARTPRGPLQEPLPRYSGMIRFSGQGTQTTAPFHIGTRVVYISVTYRWSREFEHFVVALRKLPPILIRGGLIVNETTTSRRSVPPINIQRRRVRVPEGNYEIEVVSSTLDNSGLLLLTQGSTWFIQVEQQ